METTPIVTNHHI